MGKRFRRCAALLLCAATVFLTGCQGGLPWNQDRTASLYEDDPGTSASPSPTVTIPETITDKRFTLKYEADDVLNPLVTTDPYNIIVSQLMYESLYIVSNSFTPEPVLAESMSTEDGITWEITVRSGILMHDGRELTAADVAYSVNESRSRDKYIERLTCIQEFTVTGTYTIHMVLEDTNYNCAVLLDIPVIREGSIAENVPVGSGPYVFSRTISGGKLVTFRKYRAYDSLPISEIALANTEKERITLEFIDSNLDILHNDPTGNNAFNIRVDTESHYYDSTVLQYVGFNTLGLVTSNHLFRQAIYYAVDRTGIARETMGGAALASPLMLSPAMSGYDRRWAPEEDFSITTMSSILAGMGFSDANSDGYLEYPLEGKLLVFDLVFLVNSENPYKVEAANRIADVMKSIGLNVKLKVLEWDDFTEAVRTGEFDMYYGEVRLTPDFDLRDLVTRYGNCNFGRQLGVSDAELVRVGKGGTAALSEEQIDALEVTYYSQVIRTFLAADGDDARAVAAKAMCDYFMEDCYVLPVVYKKYNVLVHRNVVKGLDPTVSGIFHNITDWSIDLS